MKTKRRQSVLNMPHSDLNACVPVSDSANNTMHCELEFTECDSAMTSERLKIVHRELHDDDVGVGDKNRRRRKTIMLSEGERNNLRHEQGILQKTLYVPHAGSTATATSSVGGSSKVIDGSTATATDVGVARRTTVSAMKRSFKAGGSSLKSGVQFFGKEAGSIKYLISSIKDVKFEEEEEDLFEGGEEEEEEEVIADDELVGVRPPQDQLDGDKELGTADRRRQFQKAPSYSRLTVKAQFMTAKLRARLDPDDGVLGTQGDAHRHSHRNSIRGNKFLMYNANMSVRGRSDLQEGVEVESKEIDLEDISYVRKPSLGHIVKEYEALQNHPKYTLKQVVLSRRFHLYGSRFGNAQFDRTLVYPTLPQPREVHHSYSLCMECKEEEPITEKQRSRTKGHRFIIAADTQFGILMDGFAMESPNWSQEIEISRKCVAQINEMQGTKRPLFVCVCGDLVDTESSFSGAIASWKKVMDGWKRNLVFEQQVRDFKRVWAGLAPDIGLVCLCGNHDVGNRPTKASISRWTTSFGDEYLSFWVNGTFNICLNNCLFSNPEGAPDMFAEQLQWMEEKLVYARENDATHIFVYGHFPWFLTDEEEADDFLTSYSSAPAGWGPPGAKFADSYFTVPYEQRMLAMTLFKKYDVTACFSGHFHQNVVAESSWGMPMIVTGPLSMNLFSEISSELSNGETNGIGMRVVDVGERGEFTHKWTLLDDEEELYEHAVERCVRQTLVERDIDVDGDDEEEIEDVRNSLIENLWVSPAEAMNWNAEIDIPEDDI